MASGTQKKIGSTRSPRVQITYDVEVGDAIKQKALPFVIGVLSDLNPTGSIVATRLIDRSFIEVDVDNFDKVMSALKPTVTLSVPNKLNEKNEKLSIEMSFLKIESFHPASIAKAVPQLAKLLETRAKLNDLLAKLEGNDRLNDLLAEVVLNTVVQEKACSEIKKT